MQELFFKEQQDFIKEQIKTYLKSKPNTAMFGESTHNIWYTNSAATTLTIIPKKYNIISRELIELNHLETIQLDPLLKYLKGAQELTYKCSFDIDKKTCDVFVNTDSSEITINHNLIKHFEGHDEFKFYGTHSNAPVYIKFNGEVVKMILPIKRC